MGSGISIFRREEVCRAVEAPQNRNRKLADVLFTPLLESLSLKDLKNLERVNKDANTVIRRSSVWRSKFAERIMAPVQSLPASADPEMWDAILNPNNRMPPYYKGMLRALMLLERLRTDKAGRKCNNMEMILLSQLVQFLHTHRPDIVEVMNSVTARVAAAKVLYKDDMDAMREELKLACLNAFCSALSIGSSARQVQVAYLIATDELPQAINIWQSAGIIGLRCYVGLTLIGVSAALLYGGTIAAVHVGSHVGSAYGQWRQARAQLALDSSPLLFQEHLLAWREAEAAAEDQRNGLGEGVQP